MSHVLELTGPPNTGKTCLALMMAIGATLRGHVLYIGDAPAHRLGDCLKHVCDVDAVPVSLHFASDDVPVSDVQKWAGGGVHRPTLIIVDAPVSAVRRHQLSNVARTYNIPMLLVTPSGGIKAEEVTS
jgi:hypothetical protein